MTIAYWCVLAALLAPYFLSVIARAGAKKDDYVGDPRTYNESLEGWRRRANFAQLNAFESFPAFAAAVIIAHLANAAQSRIDLIAGAFVLLRLLHAIFYITDKSSLRSYSWQFSMLCVIALFVVAALSDKTSPREELAKRDKKAVDIEAYDLFLQGWAHYNRETPEGYSDAIPLLKGAVARDASFHRPHAVLAAIYYQGRLRRWHQRWGLSSYDAFRKAYEHLQSSMAEPSALGLSVSSLMHIYNGRHEQAITEANKAVVLDPNDPTAHIVLAHALTMAGKGLEALNHTEQATRLNPHFPASYEWTVGLAHFVNGNYVMAKEMFEKSGTDHAGLDLVPLLATYGALGQAEEARAVLDVQRQRWQEWHPGHPMTVRSLVAEFPPLLRAVDRNRLTKGLKRALETS